MSLGSLLASLDAHIAPGAEAVVSVGVATLWASPDRVRAVDEPAVWSPSRPRDWVEAMSADDRADLRGRALTQLLLGEKVVVRELRGDWAKVVALGQPTSLDAQGYPGWVPADQISPVDGFHAAGVKVAARHRDRGDDVEDRSGVWHVVTATATALRDDPDAALAVPGVTFGTRLLALGAPFDGWLPVAVPGRFEPAWAIEDDVAAVPLAPPYDHAEVLPWADRLRDVPHVWGGGSAYGVDAPGLVHLVWRRFGVTLPREAHDLARSVTQIEPGQERPGDLYFFATSGGQIDHVGFVAAPSEEASARPILHADDIVGRVVLEDLPPQRAAVLVGIGRVHTG
ncbi:MAG TPA: NlpC/P60 family protein [Micromonosporaceae bacterium]